MLGNTIDGTQAEYWSQNITITTRLVDTVTTPTLLKMVSSEKINLILLISHHFNFQDILLAYETFINANQSHAIKMIVHFSK